MTLRLRRPVSRLWLLAVVLAALATGFFILRRDLPQLGSYLVMTARDRAYRLRGELPARPGDRAIVRDAIRRWDQTPGWGPADLEHCAPVVVHSDTPPQRCVEFRFREPAVGGTPRFCYQADADVLARAYPPPE